MDWLCSLATRFECVYAEYSVRLCDPSKMYFHFKLTSSMSVSGMGSGSTAILTSGQWGMNELMNVYLSIQYFSQFFITSFLSVSGALAKIHCFIDSTKYQKTWFEPKRLHPCQHWNGCETQKKQYFAIDHLSVWIWTLLKHVVWIEARSHMHKPKNIKELKMFCKNEYNKICHVL